MAKGKDTKIEKEIDHILKSGLVIKKNQEYFGYIGGDNNEPVEISLGSSDKELLDNLENLNNDDVTLLKAPTAESKDPKQEPTTVDEALQSQSTLKSSDKIDALNMLLDGISDLSPEDGGSDLDVYLDGVDVNLATSPKLPKDHPVKTIPLQFRWNDRRNNVVDGDLNRNHGWTVLRKDLAKKIGITTNRDDTPDQNFFTVKSYVLCVCKKDQFVIKKLKQAIKYKLMAAVQMEKRQQAARDAAIRSRTDIDSAVDVYKQDALATLRDQAEVGQVALENKRSAEEIMKNLESDSLQELLALNSDVDRAVNNGELINTKNKKSPIKQSVPVPDEDI